VGQLKTYAVIDPYDTIPEMHDKDDLIKNNMTYGLIQPAATAFADMGLVAEGPPYDAISYALGDPKPTVSLYVPRASLAAVARFEVGGTQIGLPVEGRVFEVAAYKAANDGESMLAARLAACRAFSMQVNLALTSPPETLPGSPASC
jgi:hypothetical protein